MNNRNDSSFYGEPNTWVTDEALGLTPDDKEIKRASSRIHLSLFIYLIISYITVFAVTVAIGIFLPSDEYEKLATDGAFNIALSIVSQYLVAFPIFIVIMRLLSKPEKPIQEKICFKELAVLTLIAEGLMLAGSIVGNYLSQIIGNLFGITPSNSLDTLLDGTPLWLTVLSVVILAPIVEEIIFRKMIIDRLSRFGGALAVTVSSVAFALIHANLYQFPYALAVGLLLGYIYLRSGKVVYTVAIHMIMNFLGSVAIIPVGKASEKLEELLPIIEAGGSVDTAELVIANITVAIYSVLQTALILGGIAALILYVTRKRREAGNRELFPDARRSLASAYLNVGAILFAILTLILTFITLFSF